MEIATIAPAGALKWAPTRYRAIEPTEEYGRRACEAGREVWQKYIDYMAERGMTDAPVLEIAFLETVGDELDGPSIGKAGFYSFATPLRIYIVVDKAPLEEVAWWTRHETAHAIHFLLEGPTSNSPRGEALADKVAGPDVPAGHAEWLALSAGRVVMFPPSWHVADILPAIGAGDETLALPAEATGITVTGGKISVKNPGGTVIIDGTSDLFKVGATGTLTIASGPAQHAQTTAVLDNISPGIGAWPAIPPANNFFTMGAVLPYIHYDLATGTIVSIQTGGAEVGTISGTTRAAFTWANINDPIIPGGTASVRYYLFSEATL